MHADGFFLLGLNLKLVTIEKDNGWNCDIQYLHNSIKREKVKRCLNQYHFVLCNLISVFLH